jgi:hypothetical protein
MTTLPDIPRIPIATSAVAVVVTTLDAQALDQHLVAMSPEEVAEFALRAAAIAKVAAKAKALAHARLVELGQTGQVFTDPADGTPYQLTGGRHRKIKNVGAFVEQLASEGIDARPLLPWLASDAFKVGTDIQGDERIKAAVLEWAVWVDDPLTLVELDPRTMRPVRG